MLKGGDQSRSKALELIYRQNCKTIKRLIIDGGGSPEDFEDIYQETIIVLYKSIVEDRFKYHSSISTYVYAIAKNKWIDFLRRKRKITFTSYDQNQPKEKDLVVHDFAERQDEVNFAKELMEKLAEDCKKVLLSAIYHQKSMKEIAKEMGYANEQIARNKKYKCQERLRKIINSSPKYKALLKELYGK